VGAGGGCEADGAAGTGSCAVGSCGKNGPNVQNKARSAIDDAKPAPERSTPSAPEGTAGVVAAGADGAAGPPPEAPADAAVVDGCAAEVCAPADEGG
jgi:hypothetical protein